LPDILPEIAIIKDYDNDKKPLNDEYFLKLERKLSLFIIRKIIQQIKWKCEKLEFHQGFPVSFTYFLGT
jgi:hypothetical protein